MRAAESSCYGTVGNGRLENGVKLPASGSNFTAYSTLASHLGRTDVHSRVRDVVLAAYRALETAAPGTVFVFGETGWANGGRIRPHRTHQNGPDNRFALVIGAFVLVAVIVLGAKRPPAVGEVSVAEANADRFGCCGG